MNVTRTATCVKPTLKNQPTDIPGLPTLAEVNEAMSMEGRKSDHTRAMLVISAWDGPAWRQDNCDSVAVRRQRSYECAARTLQAYDAAAAAKAPVVKAVPVSRPRSAGKTRVIFDASRPTKAPRTFGSGVLATHPVVKAPASLADMEWAASQAFATDAFSLDGEYSPDEAGEPDWDALARESALMDKVCGGYYQF